MDFNPDQFLQQTVDGPLATSVEQINPGEYRAMTGEINAKSFTNIKWNDKQTGEERNGVILSVPFIVQSPEEEARLGRTPRADMRMFLDLTDAGGIDSGTGKNVSLGRLRDALGQNEMTGWTFASLSNQGPVMVLVEHEADKKDPEKKYARVTKVTKIV